MVSSLDNYFRYCYIEVMDTNKLYIVTLWYKTPINSSVNKPGQSQRHGELKVAVVASYDSKAYDLAGEALRARYPRAELRTDNGKELFDIKIFDSYAVVAGD